MSRELGTSCGKEESVPSSAGLSGGLLRTPRWKTSTVSAIVLFCIAVLAAAFNLPSGAVRFGTRYFSGLQGGRDPQSSVSAVAPTVGSSPGGTNKEKSSTEESRTLRGVQGGGGDADENLGRGSRGGQSGSSEKRWASRDEWVKWKGASMEKEVRLHWRTRFYLGLIGTIVLSGAGFIHWVLSFRAPELTGDTVYSQVQTSQSVPSAVASMAVLYVTAGK
uniref:Transmembrane protein n=1 Tax=Chromera velia CCMP2878 TaxID=1169474 RepID=A0A0G4GK87_9ALVE|eukprot:Cvel_22279.t1-p1 / transcript=Cvel_22279.t1 / gene=Cvel_22279 / organism=Chromera_velia_CCMP2878 / gene_product=hypothetical protein / transcript_product=hypothetical protein / location=Cvel_scaffold2175:1487-4900(+) / protein_length=219 / sequence_SO=supercontig / SO=protein_coding / is_pseudo=false